MAVNRRHFLRRAANATFAGVAFAAAGKLVSPTEAFGYASHCASPTGLGCPRGCGNGQCCNVSSRPASVPLRHRRELQERRQALPGPGLDLERHRLLDVHDHEVHRPGQGARPDHVLRLQDLGL